MHDTVKKYTYKTSTELFALLGIGIMIVAPFKEIVWLILFGLIVTTGVPVDVLEPGVILIPNEYVRFTLLIGQKMLIGNVKLFVGGISAILN